MEKICYYTIDMIIYADNLYLTEKLKNNKKKLDDILWKIDHRAGLVSARIIALASNDRDVFDIIPPYLFKEKVFLEQDIHVIGIAEDESTANELVVQMINEYVNDYANGYLEILSMRDYFIKKCL